MALVVFLRGVNVGGYRKFRPSELAKQLRRYDVVNLGAAGTFVVRKPITRSKLRAELARRLPFEADILICSGNEILRLVDSAPFTGKPADPKIVHFVSVLARRQKSPTPLPLDVPARGEWGVRVLGGRDQFVYGIHRREMKAIGQLGELTRSFGCAVTTRSWSTIVSIARILRNDKT